MSTFAPIRPISTVMKILLLHPGVNAEHPIALDFKSRGISLLFPAQAEEAWQLLQIHGQSVDLAVIRREGLPSEPKGAALRLISQIKSDPGQSDLPLILTTTEWTEQQCAQHQKSSDGANAYIYDSLNEKNLLGAIEAVLGRSFSVLPEVGHPPVAPGMKGSLDLKEPELPEEPEAQVKLVDAGDESHPETSLKILSEFNLEVHSDLGSYESSQTSVVPSAELVKAPEDIPPPEAEGAFEVSLMMDLKEPSEGIEMSVSPESPAAQPGISESAIPELAIPESLPVLEDSQAEEEMPYLYQSKVQPWVYQPLGDAVVPGGAAQSPDVETIKKYLLLREQDVAVLSSQLKEARDQILATEKQFREERAKNAELVHTCQEQKVKIDGEAAKQLDLLAKFEGESQDLRFQLRTKADQIKVFEAQAHKFSDELSQLKERVRMDIRKIRVREKELENRLEITRRDSEAMLSSREAKLIELKRNLDLMEFNMDLVQNQYAKEKEVSGRLREKVAKLAQVVKVAEGLLDAPSTSGERMTSSESQAQEEESEKKVS